MRTLRLATVLLGLVTSLSEGASEGARTNMSTNFAADRQEQGNSVSKGRADDLEWLVGRWRCVTRQYFAKHEHLLAGRGEDSLDYFNVYLPYADDNLTLELTDDPERRPIAAEFLVRYIDDTGPFKEQLAPMSPGGLVRIGRDRIWYGSPPANDFEFKYSVEKRGHRLWLILESKNVRLELLKLFAPVGDLAGSSVTAPVKDYPREKLAELARQYETLRRRAMTTGDSPAQQKHAPTSLKR